MRPGEDPPAVEPLRYTTTKGYVKLVWFTETEAIEVYEHRFLVGAEEGAHVHHRNHDPSDNRLDNLEMLSPEEHREHHALENSTIDIERAIALYNEGLGTVRIGKLLGCDPAALWRALRRNGVPTRPQQGGKRPPSP